MNIVCEWHGDNFNVNLSTKEGAEPFLEVKGCRIANGSKGPFVSWPSTKNANTGKWWQHCYASDKFNAVVLSTAQASQPQTQSRKPAPSAASDDSDIPFRDPLSVRGMHLAC